MAEPVVVVGSWAGKPVEKVQFQVRYGGKVAHLILSRSLTPDEEAVAIPIFQRELQEFLEALQGALSNPAGIRWPVPWEK